MELLRNFNKVSKSDTSLAGGKGASLGEMTQSGIPVPPGFVILADVFEKFLEQTDLNVEIEATLDSVDHKKMHTIEKASEKIQALILGVEMPKDIAVEIQKFFKTLNAKYVAVRSSATAEDSASAAWAGQLESYLNTTEENLLENVKKCWASLFTPRAIFYRFEKDLHKQKISVAVVIQKMVESEKSGIAFSVHPVTQDRNQLIIEAGFGLGESIVSGQITPDSYVIEKQPRRIIDKNIQAQTKGLYRAKNSGNEWRDIPKEQGEKQVLSDKEILELTKIILRIENHYNFPCDIEWTLKKEKFYIVQSRPITTLTESKVGLKKQVILTELLHVNAPLAVAELTYEGESLEIIPWTKNKFQFRPYCVFEVKNDLLFYYYNKKGIDWKIQEAGKANRKKVIKKSLEIFSSIKEIILKEKILNLNQLRDFTSKIRIFWVWLDCLWWMIEYCDKNKLEMVDLMGVRKETEYFMPGLSAVLRKSIVNIYPKLSKYKNVLLLREVISESIPSAEELKKRLVGCVYAEGRVFLSIDDFKKSFSVRIDESIPEKSGELYGQTAYAGKVRGIARIISGRKDMAKFNFGEIIVSSTTTPDYLPIMKKSGAIISEHGGAICHAAITSRELKIPCVVGVKFATKVIQDGDMVEVDADNGVVRIIEKSK